MVLYGTYTIYGDFVRNICVGVHMASNNGGVDQGSKDGTYQGLYSGTLTTRRGAIQSMSIYVFLMVCTVKGRGKLTGVGHTSTHTQTGRGRTICHRPTSFNGFHKDGGGYYGRRDNKRTYGTNWVVRYFGVGLFRGYKTGCHNNGLTSGRPSTCCCGGRGTIRVHRDNNRVALTVVV